MRSALVGLALAMSVAGSSTEAFAQTGTYTPPRVGLYASWVPVKTVSVHEDNAEVGVSFGISGGGHNPLNGLLSLRVGHEWGGGTSTQVVGGLRIWSNRFAWPSFIDIVGGVIHFTDSTHGYIEPGAGLLFPWNVAGHPLYGALTVPIIMFEGNTEVGIGARVGIQFGLKK